MHCKLVKGNFNLWLVHKEFLSVVCMELMRWMKDYSINLGCKLISNTVVVVYIKQLYLFQGKRVYKNIIVCHPFFILLRMIDLFYIIEFKIGYILQKSARIFSVSSSFTGVGEGSVHEPLIFIL